MSTVLVANRGEIARRVLRACRALELRGVAVCTDADRAAPHVRDADEAVRITDYLSVDAVVVAALRAGADAVHPGYGFLSERAELARAVQDAGLRFVGPPADVIERMGRKDAAREIALAAGVPVVPSVEIPSAAGGGAGPVPDAFPLLVKAAAGGGGKGMRVVRAASELEGAVAAARREAAAAFGDDTILLERYVEHGRHVEVQVLADTHGTVVHLFERDCSTQRRHQKVLEEAPAPTISAELRSSLTDAAVALARHVGYVNAGTVEFLVDPAATGGRPAADGRRGDPPGIPAGAFAFLEMNTRLQVEHPVTELVTGLDLVQLQLRVAAGEPLPFTQADVRVWGHAIEARVYAEDPYAGFLPQAGTATYVHWPRTVRVDAALGTGDVVGTAYDPMLGKVIAHGSDRETARRALVTALDDTVVLGLTTNTGFLRELAASAEFRDAAVDTAWLDSVEVHRPDEEVARLLAAWAEGMAPLDPADGPFAADGWRAGAGPAPVLVALDRDVVIRRPPGPGSGSGEVAGYQVRELARGRDDGTTRLTLELGGDGDDLPGRGRHHGVVRSGPHAVEVAHRGQRWVFKRPDVFADHAVHAGDGTVVAPMPGSLLAVRAAVGQRVAEGEVLAIVEAMKMELALRAPFTGTVTAVPATVGQQVALGAALVVVEPEAEP